MYIVQEKRKRPHIPNGAKHCLHEALETRTKLLGRERNLGFVEVDVEEREDVPQLRGLVVQERDVNHLRAESYSEQLHECGQVGVERQQLSKDGRKAR